MTPALLIEKTFTMARESAEAGHTSWCSLHDLPPALVVEESEPGELYRTQSSNGDWYLVGRRVHETAHGQHAGVTLFSTVLDDDGFDHLPTQEEHDARLISKILAGGVQ